MLVRDLKSGQLVDVPAERVVSPGMSGLGRFGFHQYGNAPRTSMAHGLGAYSAAPAQIIYDGLGNPVGVLPFLAALKPLAAKLLPTLATKAGGLLKGLLPQITSALPLMTGGGAAPQPVPGQTVTPAPEAAVGPAPPMLTPMAPPQAMPAAVPAPEPTVTPLPPMPGSAAVPVPVPPGSAALSPASAAEEEVAVVPMRVRTPSGGTAVVPVRVRRRRRRVRGRRMVRIVPPMMQSALPLLAPRPIAAPVASARDLHGWHGFSGWASY
jgi:hypothetical protein